MIVFLITNLPNLVVKHLHFFLYKKQLSINKLLLKLSA